MSLKRYVPLLLALQALWTHSPEADAQVFDVELIPGARRFTLDADPSVYYILKESPDLGKATPFTPIAIELGEVAPVWEIPILPGRPRIFFAVEPVDLFAPYDTDGDGIDDVYELERPVLLDPLDGADAGDDPDGNGATHLEDYIAAGMAEELLSVMTHAWSMDQPATSPGLRFELHNSNKLDLNPVDAPINVPISGILGNALETDGADDALERPIDSTLVFNDQNFSGSMLAGFGSMVPSGISRFARVWGNAPNFANAHWEVSYDHDAGELQFSWVNSGNSVEIATVAHVFLPNTFDHVAWTYDAENDEGRIFVNSVSGASRPGTKRDTEFQAGTRLEVGAAVDDGLFHAVRLSDLLLFHGHVLTQAQIDFLHNAGAFRSYYLMAKDVNRTAYNVGNSISIRAGFSPSPAGDAFHAFIGETLSETFTNGMHTKFGNSLFYMQRFPFAMDVYKPQVTSPKPWKLAFEKSTYQKLITQTYEAGYENGKPGYENEGGAIVEVIDTARQYPQNANIEAFLILPFPQQNLGRFDPWVDYRTHWEDYTVAEGTFPQYWLNKASNIKLLNYVRHEQGKAITVIPTGDIHAEFGRVALNGGIPYEANLPNAPGPYGLGAGVYRYAEFGADALTMDRFHQSNVGAYMLALGCAKVLYDVPSVESFGTAGAALYDFDASVGRIVLKGTPLTPPFVAICQKIVDRVMNAKPYDSAFYYKDDSEPYAWWTFSEPTGNNRIDAWNGRQLMDDETSSATADVEKVAGPAPGVAAAQCGGHDRGLIGHGEDFNIPQASESLAVFLTFQNDAADIALSNQLVCRWSVDVGHTPLWTVHIAGGPSSPRLNFQMRVGGQINRTRFGPLVNDTDWHRAVCVFDRTDQKLFIHMDGVIDTVGVPTGDFDCDIDPDTPLTLGYQPPLPTQNPYEGKIANVVLMHRVPTSEELSEYMEGTNLVGADKGDSYPLFDRRIGSAAETIKTDLVSVYDFEGDINDSFGVHHLTNSTPPAVLLPDVFPFGIGYGVEFDAPGDHRLTVDTTAHRGGSGGLYVAALITPDIVTGTRRGMVTRWKETGDNREWELSINTSGQLAGRVSADGFNFSAEATSAAMALTPGQRHFVELWYDGSDVYVNVDHSATPASQAHAGGIFAGGDARTVFGAFEGNSSNNFDGTVHSVWIRQGAPTKAQRAWLYNRGNQRLSTALTP